MSAAANIAFIALLVIWLPTFLTGVALGIRAERRRPRTHEELLRSSAMDDKVRRAVRIAEEEIQNIWDQNPSPAVLARTVVYALGRISTERGGAVERER